LVGLPGFANLPGLGYAFSTKSNSLKNTEFLILVTPRRLRDPIRNARSIFAGHGDTAAGRSAVRGAPLPTVPEQQPPLQPPQP